jgi:hypothetical protein
VRLTNTERALKRGADELAALCEYALRGRALKHARKKYVSCCASLYSALGRHHRRLGRA